MNFPRSCYSFAPHLLAWNHICAKQNQSAPVFQAEVLVALHKLFCFLNALVHADALAQSSGKFIWIHWLALSLNHLGLHLSFTAWAL